ncbi:MAG: VCBS repeat-containing protein, partial [Anaerolineales bacterium]|nr:VCBS repeat-containing protein [Anaerolineales bacterium]
GSYAATRASRGYVARSNTLSDTVSLTFAGTWAGLGFVTATSSGYVEVRLDGVSRGIVDTYSATNDVTEVYYSGLVSGTHTLEVIVLDDANPSAGNTYVHLDYIDVWNGVDEADGWYEADRTYADNDRVDMSADWDIVNDVGARGGAFWEDGSNAWFRFTGEAVTVRAFGHGNDAASAQVWIDGVDYGVLDLNYEWTRSPLVFHYTGLDAGPHVLRFQGFTKPGLDAFEANPTAFDPGVPLVEWADVDITGAVLNTAVAGDINGDGVTELVSTSSNGTMYVYRGDGQDAGTGSPLIWSVALGGEPDSAALADLDGQAGSEIVVGSPTGLYAFHADGSLYWFTNAVKSTWRAISIGNLDDDPEPEIVTTGQNCPCVIEPDGSAVTWRGTFNYPLTPNLADLTGDGRLDILTGSGSTLYLYDTSTNPPTLAWSTTLPATIDGRGTPAIADVDGQQPGGDDGPEIVVVSSGAIHLLDADGTELWSYATAAGAPGGVSIADTDGDGEVEIIASAQVDGGTLYALNADGTLLWNAPAVDTTSANSVSVLDLDGDGVWEVVWNGFNQGLTVFRGSDGAILFNEPLINSTTRIDYPIIADVDGDGAAEIVTNDDQGFYVVGFDPVWAPSRPLWNQYNYAITNVGDDLSVPPTEPPSWLVHNTYRTQTPLNTVLPAYQVTITHTASITGVHVLSDTFVISPTIAGQDYAWGYTQRWYEANRGNRFDAVLPDMTPGELRQISEGTEVVYRLPSGRNHLTLPPLFVSALHIIAVAPPTSTVSPGGSATYTVTLTNPAATADVYALSLAGLPPEWVALPASVNMPANSVVDVPLVVQPPVTAADSAHLFVVSVVNIGGGQDEAGAALTVSDGLDLTLDP